MSKLFKTSIYTAVLAMIASFATLPLRAGEISTATKGDFTFINFDPLTGIQNSNVNGISNKGHVVGFTINADGSFTNFTGTPNQTLQLNAGTGAMAFGINRWADVVGAANGAAFFLTPKTPPQALPLPAGATSSSAFGISDKGAIVGQYTNAKGQTPGFYLKNMNVAAVTINAPSGPNTVNAQGVNNFGLVVGFYVGTDGQDHGFILNAAKVRDGSTVTGTAVPDPVIPNVVGETGATFVFSQILAVNDAGIAVGYYGDSTTSQHGFIYDTNTGKYTFLDDPKEAFSNGVEVTQITGINDSGELGGFYTDASAVAHSFTACLQFTYCANFPHDLP